MMRWSGTLVAATFLSMLSAAAAEKDPDWPCVQRKVPELSLGQIWTGPDLPPGARDWNKDAAVAALVTTLSQRRMPLDEAKRQIEDFAGKLPASELHDTMAKLVQGLFDKMNMERSHVISAIGRYSRKQLEFAAMLRDRASELAAIRDPNDAEAVRRSTELALGTRIYNERMQNLTYVCEVPTLIEQRLYALARIIAPTISKKADH
jgi:hypothetical protein